MSTSRKQFLTLNEVIKIGANPCGYSLVGLPELVNFMTFCTGKEEQFLSNNHAHEAIGADWSKAINFGRELLQTSADLSVIAWLATACLHRGTLLDFCDCIVLMADLIEQFPDACFPRVDIDPEDGSADAGMRVAALRHLMDVKLVIKPLQHCAVELDEYGKPAIRVGERPSNESLRTEILSALEEARLALFRLQKSAQSQYDEPEFSVHSLVRELDTLIQRYLGQHSANNSLVAENAVIQGAAINQSDAVSQIDFAIQYFERYEPSSPVASILRQAKAFVGKDFWGMIKELGGDRLVGTVSDSKLLKPPE